MEINSPVEIKEPVELKSPENAKRPARVKRLIVDMDNTISRNLAGDYATAEPVVPVIRQLQYMKSLGFEIVIFSSRNMRTYDGCIGKINANTLPVMLDWLKRHDVPFDEIYVGKPWCGQEGFYVDDRAVRPREFCEKSLDELEELMRRDRL